MAQQMAQTGIPQAQYNNQLNGINQNQAGAIGALSQSANPGAGLASIVRAGNSAVGNLNAQDATARAANQRFAIGQNGILGQQELAAQQYNKFDKYSENFNRSQALKSAANTDMQNAFDGASKLANGLATNYTLGHGNYGFGNPASYSGASTSQMSPYIGAPQQQTPETSGYYLNQNYTNF